MCLTATASGVKRKLFFVFKGGKLEVAKLNEEYKAKYVMATSATGWINDELIQRLCREVTGVFTFRKLRLLAWNTFRCHLTWEIRPILNEGRINNAIVPGGYIKLIQGPDLSWNKPLYNEWLAADNHHITAQGNMRPPSRQQMIEWVLEAWGLLPSEIIT